MTLLPQNLINSINDRHSSSLSIRGTLISVRGSILCATLPSVTMGSRLFIHRRSLPPLPALVVGFDAACVQLLPLEHPEGISPGAIIESGQENALSQSIALGSVLDALGRRLFPHAEHRDSGAPRPPENLAQFGVDHVHRQPPPPLMRKPIVERFCTGIRTIDGLSPLGKGQRVGLFASAGVGKSTLLGSISRNAECDAVVVALVGERGREVREFLDEALGPEGQKKSIVVYATSDEPPARRMLAASTATAIAEDLRAQGKNVLLLVDSLTRVARAIREVSLCLGELPVRQGYTPSVFTELPRLLERAGNSDRGSITAMYTVLTTEEGEPDALGEELISLLDGHLRMSTRMSKQGIFPAIDPTISLSRLAPKLQTEEGRGDSQRITQGLAKLWRERDMLLFGGTPSPELAHLLKIEANLKAFLTQEPADRVHQNETDLQRGQIARALMDSGKSE